MLSEKLIAMKNAFLGGTLTAEAIDEALAQAVSVESAAIPFINIRESYRHQNYKTTDVICSRDGRRITVGQAITLRETINGKTEAELDAPEEDEE